MFAAIALGIIAGALSFAPLVVSLRMTRKLASTSNFGNMSVLLIGVFVSLAILIVSAVACIKLARDLALPFVLAEGITLSVVAIGYGVAKMVRK